MNIKYTEIKLQASRKHQGLIHKTITVWNHDNECEIYNKSATTADTTAIKLECKKQGLTPTVTTDRYGRTFIRYGEPVNSMIC